MKSNVPETVEEYLATVPEDQLSALMRIRNIIQEAVPEAVEGISYQIPTFKYLGPLVAFAAFKKHCSFYLMSTAVMDAYRKELESYDTAKGTIHFQPDKPLPEELVIRLVKARVEENKKLRKEKKK